MTLCEGSEIQHRIATNLRGLGRPDTAEGDFHFSRSLVLCRSHRIEVVRSDFLSGGDVVERSCH